MTMPAPAPFRSTSTAGFTLAETLVGLALLGMMAALLLAGLHIAGVVVMRDRAKGEGLDQVVGAQRMIARVIERLRPVMRMDALTPMIDARGDPGVFTFIAPALMKDGPTALQRYRLMRAPTGDILLYSASLRHADLDLSATGMRGWQALPILSGASALSIAYFGSEAGSARRHWQDRWWNRGQPPELVRIRIEFPPGDTRRWPDLVVRPRAVLDAPCRPDPLTGGCEPRP